MDGWVAIQSSPISPKTGKSQTAGGMEWNGPNLRPDQRRHIWELIIGWLLIVGLLLFVFAFNVEAAAEFTEKMYLTEVDGNVQLAMMALDQKAQEKAAELGMCLKEKLRRKVVMFDFTQRETPMLWITYACGETQTKTPKKEEPLPY